ncbi:MAG: hypothetical protein WD669_00530 [Pirellulales bacterium]
MGNRIFVATVILLWTGTMSWLVAARILPPFFRGEPPSHGALIETEPNCWQIELRGQKVGYAASQAVPGAAGTTEVHSRVRLDGIELRKLWPFQVGSLGSGTIRLDTRTRLVIDSLGSLSSFDTKVQLTDVPLVINVRGRVEGAQLKVTLQSGDTTHDVAFPVPARALSVNEFFPESRLLDLTVGRRWQQEVFSPFKTSLEIVEAQVVAEGSIDHRGEQHNARRIEYRSLGSSGVAADNTLRSVLWVAEDGTVLRQDLYLMGATLRFERCSEPRMIKMAQKLLDLDTHATVTTPQPAL